MSSVLSVIAALLVLSVFIFLHELGHFLVGKKLGFSILEFAVGMGPVLLSKTKDGIQYSLRALPIGGMCRFYGEDEDAQGDGRAFGSFPAWKKILTVAAGPVVNLVLALVLSCAMVLAYGIFMPAVSEVQSETCPAAVCGLETGDILLKVDGREIESFYTVVDQIQATGKEGFTLTVKRGNEEVELTIKDAFDEEKGSNFLGITMSAERFRVPFFKALSLGAETFNDYVRATFSFLGSLFRGQVSKNDVSGPVGTVAFLSEAVRYGFEVVLELSVMINISLGMLNLLPIPAMDGGRLVFLFIELVRGKPIDQNKEGTIHFIGLILLFGLMLFLTFNDVTTLFHR